jgi:hypothetical protein
VCVCVCVCVCVYRSKLLVDEAAVDAFSLETLNSIHSAVECIAERHNVPVPALAEHVILALNKRVLVPEEGLAVSVENDRQLRPRSLMSVALNTA